MKVDERNISNVDRSSGDERWFPSNVFFSHVHYVRHVFRDRIVLPIRNMQISGNDDEERNPRFAEGRMIGCPLLAVVRTSEVYVPPPGRDAREMN